MDAILIDGTKIGAYTNKYTFVWEKTVSKNLKRLLSKLADFTAEYEEMYGLELVYQSEVKIKHVKKLRKKHYALKQEENIEFVHGCVKRKTPIQCSIEKLEEYLNKLKGYTRKTHILNKENLEIIVSEEGCELRMNRGIQAEGSSGEIKQDMGFRRFLSKGKNNILSESILLAMAHNINKLHNKIQSGRTKTHLFPLKESA